jgi:hypothetical protein
LIATNKNDRWFFMLGFEKNQQENIGVNELKTLKDTAYDLLKLTDKGINDLLIIQKIKEIHHD